MNQALGFPGPEVPACDAKRNIHSRKLAAFEQAVDLIVSVQAVVEEKTQLGHLAKVLAHLSCQVFAHMERLGLDQCQPFLWGCQRKPQA